MTRKLPEPQAGLPRRGSDVERVFEDLRYSADPGKWQEKAEVIGDIGVIAGDRIAGLQVLASTVAPSVARMNRALARVVAGLALSAARVAVTWQAAQTLI
jgi:hypothetical protein